MKETATPRKLAELLSAKTGLAEHALRTRVTYLREAGLQPGGTFGDSNAARLTLKAAANQILGCTASVQIEVARHVRRVGALQCDPSRYENSDLMGSGIEHVLPLLKGNKTFISALVSLLRYMTRPAVDPLSLPVRGIGVIEGAGEVQAWIEPRMSQAWQADHKAPQRMYFGRPAVIPLTTFFTQECSLNAVILYEVAQLFRGATAHQGESYEEDTASTGRPARGAHRAFEHERVQHGAEISSA